MKHISLFCACLLLSAYVFAQSKGSVTFGANALTSSTNVFENKSSFRQNLQSRVGFFPARNLSLGFCLETNLNHNETVPFGLTVYTRVYAGKKGYSLLKPFVEVGAGAAHYLSPYRPGDDMFAKNKKFHTAAYISPGVNVYVCETIALEVAAEYRYINAPEQVSRIGVSGGIKFFLTGQQFTKIFPYQFAKSY